MKNPESGNVIFFILLSIVLVGLVTAALRSGGLESAGVEREDLTIKVSQVRQNATELERALALIMQNGISETDISFATDADSAPTDYGVYNANPKAEIFNPKGGGAIWRTAPSGINDGSAWEFYGTTHLPGVGSDKADLIAVLPNVSKEFCDQINKIDRQSGTPTDTATCVFDTSTHFAPGTAPFSTSPNTMDESTFTSTSAAEACVTCSTGGGYHFYHVLMAR